MVWLKGLASLTWLDLLVAHLLAFALVGIFWLHRTIHPGTYLFTLPLVYGVHTSFNVASLAIRAGIVIVFTGIAATAFSPNVVIYASILAALYVVWPAVLHPDRLEDYVQRQKLKAYLLFLFYIGFAFALAMAGIEVRNMLLPQAKAHFAQLAQPGEVFGAFLWLVIGALLAGGMRGLGRLLIRERNCSD